jgi:capsular exopolysaccharide synthesis family protein
MQISYFSKGELLTNEFYKQTPFIVEADIKDSSIFGVPVNVEFADSVTLSVNYKSPMSGKIVTLSGKKGDLFKTPEFDFRVFVTDYATIKALTSDINTDIFFFTVNNLSTVSERIIKDLTVTPLNIDAKTIQIKLKEKNQIKATDIVNGLAQEFNKYDLEKNSEVAEKILDFIENTISSIELQLGSSESSIEQFKKSNKIIDPDLRAGSILRRLEELQSDLTQLDHQITMLGKIRRDVNQNNEIAKFILSLTGRTTSNEILEQVVKLQDLIDQRDQIRLMATENSEVFKSIDAKLKIHQELLTRTIVNEENQLITKKDILDKEIRGIESSLGDIPRQQAEFGRLKRLFNVNEKFYSLLLEKKAEFSIKKAGYVPQHIVLQEAKYGQPPVYPNRPLVISACLVAGLIAGFILLITKYLLYNEINALEEIGQYTDAALLGIIPKYKREIPISQLLVDKNPKSVISEAFRSVRTNLQFISNNENAKILAVTSTISGEGKTFNAINLAGVIAFSGLKVVILDLDMRKPKIHLGFNVENNHGISTLLIGKDSPENCILHSSLTNLDFITAGPIPPNPAELIISPRMDKLLDYLKSIYDIIIVDLPPVGIVSDGIPIMQKADYPIYILRANYSRKMFITQVNKLIMENKVSNLSIVLNGVEMSRLKYGYGYGYSYGYGYGYGYSYGYGYYDDDDAPQSLLERAKGFFVKKNK